MTQQLFKQTIIHRTRNRKNILLNGPNNWRQRYCAFKAAPSLNDLRRRFENENEEYIKWGIHVMAAQNQLGEITIGDSHENDASPDRFIKHHIYDLIISYLNKIALFKSSWQLSTSRYSTIY